MPFTLSHAAAALPFRRLNLVWSAFLVGSMAPDFPYVVGDIKYRALGHNFPGVVFFTLPASFAVLWFYHWGIKRPIVGLLPVGVQRRLSGQLGEFRFGGGRRMLAITFSIVLGVATHLIWDAFTHSLTWPWLHFAWLRSWIELPRMGWTPMTMIMQYGSSLLGLLAVAIWIVLWYRRTSPLEDADLTAPVTSQLPVAVLILVIATATGLLHGWMLLGMVPMTIRNLDWFLLNVATTAIAVAFWELLLYCLITTSREYTGRLTSA